MKLFIFLILNFIKFYLYLYYIIVEFRSCHFGTRQIRAPTMGDIEDTLHDRIVEAGNELECRRECCAGACNNQPGMYDPSTIERFLRNGYIVLIAFVNVITIDFYDLVAENRKILFIRPRTQTYNDEILARQLMGRDNCVNLTPTGCALPRDTRPTECNCYMGCRTNHPLANAFTKNGGGVNAWDTLNGRRLVNMLFRMWKNQHPHHYQAAYELDEWFDLQTTLHQVLMLGLVSGGSSCAEMVDFAENVHHLNAQDVRPMYDSLYRSLRQR